MPLTMPNFVDTLLNNPNAQTTQDGVTGGRTAPTAASRAANNGSSYQQPMSGPAIILPPPAVTDAITPNLGIPSGYQTAARSAVGQTIGTVIQTSRAQNGSTDVGSNQYTGNVATRLFSGIRSTISSSAPMFGVTKGSGPIANGLAVMANAAVKVGKNSMIVKYGSTLLNAQQYVEFGSAVLDSFHTQYDDQPEVKAEKAAKELGNTGLPIKLPPPPIQLPRPPWSENIDAPSYTQAQAKFDNEQVQQSWQRVTVQAASASQNEPASDPINPNPYAYKVYLVSTMNSGDLFVFNAQPKIQVTEQAAYSEFSPLHAPGQILSFKNSPARAFGISDFKMISRNSIEASENLKNLHMLRGWTKPYFGRSQIQAPTQVEVVDHSMDTDAGINARANSRVARQGAGTETAADAANAAEIAKLNREHPKDYVRPPTTAIPTGAVQFAPDAINQSIKPGEQLPSIAAATSRSRTVTTKAFEDPITSKTRILREGGNVGQSVNSVADARLLRQGATDTAQTAPITPTAETAQTPAAEVVTSSLGAPPEVLYLYGYSADGTSPTDGPQNLRRIPVVITSLGFDYPNDVDYIPTLDGVPFPTVMTISIELKETKSPYEIEQFSLADYRLGKLIGW
jgi:hypothetical protein